MLSLTYSPTRFKTRDVLHLAHPIVRKDPHFQEALNFVSANNRQIAFVGEHFLSETLFDRFETVILHSVPDKYLLDFIKRLKNGGYAKRFFRVKEDDERLLLVLGNAVKLLSRTLLLIPRDNPAVSSLLPSVSKIDTSTPGLGIIDIRLDIPFDISAMGTKYNRVLQELSKQQSIYLLDSRVLYSSDNTAKFGDVYRMDKGVLTKIKSLPLELKAADVEALRQRRVPPIRVNYKPESEEEVAENKLATSKDVSEVDGKHSV